jgi:hypothetical protein
MMAPRMPLAMADLGLRQIGAPLQNALAGDLDAGTIADRLVLANGETMPDGCQPAGVNDADLLRQEQPKSKVLSFSCCTSRLGKRESNSRERRLQIHE